MVKLYLRNIVSGKITLKDVPSLWHDKVKMELEKQEEPAK